MAERSLFRSHAGLAVRSFFANSIAAPLTFRGRRKPALIPKLRMSQFTEGESK